MTVKSKLHFFDIYPSYASIVKQKMAGDVDYDPVVLIIECDQVSCAFDILSFLYIDNSNKLWKLRRVLCKREFLYSFAY